MWLLHIVATQSILWVTYLAIEMIALLLSMYCDTSPFNYIPTAFVNIIELALYYNLISHYTL